MLIVVLLLVSPHPNPPHLGREESSTREEVFYILEGSRVKKKRAEEIIKPSACLYLELNEITKKRGRERSCPLIRMVSKLKKGVVG